MQAGSLTLTTNFEAYESTAPATASVYSVEILRDAAKFAETLKNHVAKCVEHAHTRAECHFHHIDMF